ncbi:hypothetical protein BGM19_37930 [Streptomyces agglomeratus]|nr:hypothetical protein BGK72_36985 [Streptomyces agglomeratus]OEJ56459.1 hypothetical protein BGM19_37930 [Streptomyces agglomeratus]
MLHTPHAFAVFASQYGYHAAVIIFRRSALPRSLSWQSATPHLPTLARAAADIGLRHVETHDRLDEITTMNNALEAIPAL